MQIVIIGASGFIGSALTAEALQRGHQVRALVRDTSKLAALQQQYPQQLQVVSVDVLDSRALLPWLQQQPLVISAFSGHSDADVSGYYQRGFASILQAVKQSAVERFLLVGGAASLQLPDGSKLLDSPNFPAAYRGTAEGAYAALQQLRSETGLVWSYLSPAAEIFPGDKTGQYRLGQDYLLADQDGRSRISTGDYAAAMLNEAEQPQHQNKRFSIAY